ncbi:MAG: type IV secretory system conjugative DNA transfer family protein, partial [Eubacteriales bacterium]|nr:type IV secretory system conjugative DNA transfer family protein [Eubacteriales bacterium]
MGRHSTFRSAAPMWAALTVPVLYLAAMLAYGYEDGMTIFDLMGRFTILMERPFSIGWTAYTPKFMLGALVCYGLGIGFYYASRENRRQGEEYGSARWGSPQQLCKKYMDHKQPQKNIILTENVRIGMDGHKHRRKLNILVVGGSGSGKTRFFCKPGVMSVNCSYLITDPKGEMLRATGGLLKAQGYDVKVFNLIDPSQSDCYNPFVYLRDEKDALKLIDNLIKNTTPKAASNTDPFWEKAEIALDSALMLYLMSEAPVEEQNFETMMFMMEYAQVREEDEQYKSPLDMLFEALEEEQPNHVAVKQYKVFKQAAGKTAKSILVSAAVRLTAFNLPQYAALTARDEMDFGSLGEKKRAIFCVIPIT